MVVTEANVDQHHADVATVHPAMVRTNIVGAEHESSTTPQELSRTPTPALMDLAAETAGAMAALAGRFLQVLGELDRREGWRAEGATSLETWITERCGLSVASARAYAHVAQRVWDLPHLANALSDGDISFDKVRALVDVATPETDHQLSDDARTCSMRELSELVQSARRQAEPIAHGEGSGPDGGRRSLRFNDTFRTVSVQLPPESYAEARASLEARARAFPSDGETPWDQRLCDAFVSLVRHPSGTSRYTVVAHVPLTALVDAVPSSDDGAGSALAGELERHGLISVETVRRVACDATVVVAVDDDVGHTMYEGRSKRFPTDTQRREIMRRDRHCRFPGCGHVVFVNAHHIRPWIAGGRTDLDNLVLLCEHHHRLLHSRHWTMAGDANDVLTFVGPTGRAVTSRPSPLWTTRRKG
jgi:Domain of unknown function (DUF222)/HNH endonuclease